MTTTFDSEITRLYEKFFETTPVTCEDNQRIAFLEVVISGKIGAHAKRKTLVDALEELKGKEAKKDFSYRRFLEAAHTARLWYEDPRNAGAKSVIQSVEAAGEEFKPVVEKVERCLAVLREYRLQELLTELETAIKSYAAHHKGPERTAVVVKVDDLMGRIKAFRVPEMLDQAIDLVASCTRTGAYPVSKEPETYAQRRAKDAESTVALERMATQPSH